MKSKGIGGLETALLISIITAAAAYIGYILFTSIHTQEPQTMGMVTIVAVTSTNVTPDKMLSALTLAGFKVNGIVCYPLSGKDIVRVYMWVSLGTARINAIRLYDLAKDTIVGMRIVNLELKEGQVACVDVRLKEPFVALKVRVYGKGVKTIDAWDVPPI